MSDRNAGIPQDPHAELKRLLGQLTDGEGGAETKLRISKLVAGDRAAARIYLRHMYLHSELARSLSAKADSASIQALSAPLHDSAEVIDLETVAKALPPISDSSKSLLKVGYWRKHQLRFGGMALVLTLLFWVGFFVVAMNRNGGDDTSSHPNGMPEGVVAQVTEVRAAEWGAAAKPYVVQQLLYGGDTLELARGYVEVAFADGAVVLLEGPAQFTADTSSAGTLTHGRLVARIVKQAEESKAIPFAIATPLAMIIDQGTEFGVEAELDGTTHIEVFEGRVEATPQGEARTPRSRPIYLVEGQAAHIVPGDEQLARNGGSEFVRDLPEGEIVPVQRSSSNWRRIFMMDARDGDKEHCYVYAYHAPAEENLLLAFDVSAFHGSTAVGPARLTLTMDEGGNGIIDERTCELALRQLNPFNAAVDLDAASSWYLDGGEDEGSVPWRDNSGASLESLGYNWSIRDITSALLDSKTGPLCGDTPTTDAIPGETITLTIPRSRLQSWLDQTAPPVVTLDLDPGEKPYIRSDGVAQVPGMGAYKFGHGEDYPLPQLTFEVVVPEVESPPAELPEASE